MTAPSFPPGFDSPEHFLAAIIDSSDDAIITKNLDGIITSWNRAAERIFGYTSEEMMGQPVLVLIPEDRRDEEPMILSRLRNGERVEHFDTKRITKVGRLIDISLTVSPVRNKGGVIVGASKIAREVTLQKQAMAMIESANDETARQSRIKDEFLATLSHELRTPLQSIMGWVQILQGGDLSPGELEQGLEVIQRNGLAQTRIIEDLLDMNRILSGKVRLDVQRLEIQSVLEAAIETIRPAAEAKGIRLNAVVDRVSKLVIGDPNRLQQVFWNLLSNAVKFTPKGGRVEVLLQRVNSHLEVSITDTGCGIPEDFLPHVFDRFRQADASSTRSQGGLGLGLAIVRHLIELHGGQVFAKSRGSDLGATFEVMLPVAAVDGPGRVSDSFGIEATNRATVPQLQGLKVLVVDDDEDSRVLVGKTLEKAGAVVTMAAGADEGLAVIDDSLPDVLISDIGMPEKDGYRFIGMVRGRSPDKGGKIPAAALTAYTRVEDRVQALCAGFQILLSKPVDAAELIATVASLATQIR